MVSQLSPRDQSIAKRFKELLALADESGPVGDDVTIFRNPVKQVLQLFQSEPEALTRAIKADELDGNDVMHVAEDFGGGDFMDEAFRQWNLRTLMDTAVRTARPESVRMVDNALEAFRKLGRIGPRKPDPVELPDEDMDILFRFREVAIVVLDTVRMSRDDSALDLPPSEGSPFKTVGEARDEARRLIEQHGDVLQRSIEAGWLDGKELTQTVTMSGGSSFFKELTSTVEGKSLISAAMGYVEPQPSLSIVPPLGSSPADSL